MAKVTYPDFPEMGLHLAPTWIRKKMRCGRFPKPIQGGYLNGNKSRYYWEREDVEKWIKARKSPRQ